MSIPLLFYGLTILVSTVGGHFLTIWILRWIHFLPDQQPGPNFSKWVGVFERAVISMLVIGGAIATTPFVFAAKAAVMAVRAPTDAEKKKAFTEYVLLGSLISYAMALAFGLLGL